MIAAGSATAIFADQAYKQEPKSIKTPLSTLSTTPGKTSQDRTVCYDYAMRSENLFAWPALLLLILGTCNYFFSFIFVLGFHKYHSAQYLMPAIDQVNCEISGSLVLTVYSVLLVMSTGTVVFLNYVLSFLYKLVHLLSTALLCPIYTT